ncbi:MAG: S8/S53 family peptidase [Ignavibacteria bacterium]
MKKITSFLLITVVIFAVSIGTKTEYTKISDRVKNAIDYSTDEKLVVYVYFNDKGPNVDQYLSNPLSLVSEKSLERRRKVLPANQLVDITDVPVYRPYMNQVSNKVTKVRHELKWFNCVSVEGTKAQVLDIAGLDCVTKIDLVERYRKVKENDEIVSGNGISFENDSPNVDSLSYGPSLKQDTMIKVNRVHNNGIYGQGVIVANFDAGYQNLNHEAFTTYPMKIWKKKDFQTGDTVNLASHSHGQATLSLVGGYKPGSLISPAFASTYVLCRTEVDPTETPSEMDYWAAAAQWADSLGVDVITSSLGYLTFDAPYTSYTYLDMNGNTLLITKAADLAVHKGITVSNSAGNDGNNTHNTLGGPADGDSVITIGALEPTGLRATYSSVGPTTDVPNRIKPDIMTQGSSNQVATQTGYSTFGSGTSWACPMAAGVMACMLSANKNLTPIQIRGILRKFSSNNASPNNLIGWGTIDAQKSVDSARAMDNTAPTILHTQPFTSTTNTNDLFFKARIFDNGIIRYTRTLEAPRIYYRKNTGGGFGGWNLVPQTSVSLDTFTFRIPASSIGTTVQYFFAAQDIALPTPKMSTLPAGGTGINPPGGVSLPTTFFQFVVGTTSITTIGNDVPKEFKLFNNYPNPFNPTTDIKYDLPKSGVVSLKVYDINGRLVKELVNQMQIAGSYTARFEASNLSSGIYFYQLTAGEFKAQNKMLLVK